MRVQADWLLWGVGPGVAATVSRVFKWGALSLHGRCQGFDFPGLHKMYPSGLRKCDYGGSFVPIFRADVSVRWC